MRPLVMLPSRYDVAISIAVTTTRIKKIITYLSGVGCASTSPGSSPGAGASTPCISACATADISPSRTLTVPSPSLTTLPSPRRSLARLGHQVDDGEDHDPDHVDEVPVETGDLDGLRLVGAEPTLH